jgi:hypothetical protein
MHSFVATQADDFSFKLLLIAFTFATCVLGFTAAALTIMSHRSSRLAKLQESQFRRRMAQITVRQRLAEIVRTPSNL